MHVLRCLALSLLLFSFQSAQSENSCTPQDISARLGPIRTQGDKGWCYAFTAADLIGYRAGITPGEQISALDLAAGYYLNPNPHIIGEISGDPSVALKSLSDQNRRTEKNQETRLNELKGGGVTQAARSYHLLGGACLESTMRSQKSQVFRDSSSFLDQRIRELSQEMTPIQPRLSPLDISNFIACDPPSKIERVASSPVSPDFVSALTRHANKQAMDSIEKICQPRMKLPHFEIHGIAISSAALLEQSMAQIDANLDRQIPTGISYEACFLRDGTKNLTRVSRVMKCPHASSVVGRRMNPQSGKCEYKIRNSWGTSCKGYSLDIYAEKACEGGHIWVSADTLKANLFGVTWLP